MGWRNEKRTGQYLLSTCSFSHGTDWLSGTRAWAAGSGMAEIKQARASSRLVSGWCWERFGVLCAWWRRESRTSCSVVAWTWRMLERGWRFERSSVRRVLGRACGPWRMAWMVGRDFPLYLDGWDGGSSRHAQSLVGTWMTRGRGRRSSANLWRKASVVGSGVEDFSIRPRTNWGKRNWEEFERMRAKSRWVREISPNRVMISLSREVSPAFEGLFWL